MPPFINRKRRQSSSEPESPPKRKKTNDSTSAKSTPTAAGPSTGRRKPKAPKKRTVATKVEKKANLFDSVDSSKSRTKIEKSKFFALPDDRSDDSDLSSEADSDDFEDAVPEKPNGPKRAAENEDEDDFEDAVHLPGHDDMSVDAPAGALELNLGGPRAATTVTYADLTGGKKQGPSKKDKQMRILAHSMHVQYLMWHNHVRNHWLNDTDVQKLLVSHMQKSQKMAVQFQSWKKKSGVEQESPKRPKDVPVGGKNSNKGKGRQSNAINPRSERDWGRPAERQAVGKPDLSHGDPLQQFLGVLATWWKQKFTITAPGLRKRGYKAPKVLRDEIQEWRQGESDIRDHGERIANIEEFRAHAKHCEGSRDVGAQLFVALLRGLGIEARMVSSLQPLGYGWTKLEDAEVRQKRESQIKSSGVKKGHGKHVKPRTSHKGGESKSKAVVLSDTSDLSDLPNAGSDNNDDDESDVSVIDITPKKRPNMPFDRDLLFPHYWIEAISSLTHKVFPVDPFLVQNSVATNSEQLMQFEVRGAKAEKARQIFAYVVAHASDNSAKDVTIRYLKKHVFPGKTKGFRLASARVPVHNRHGKVRGYYEIDWWQTALQPYLRPSSNRTIADDIEDQGDLQPVEPEKKAPKEGIPDTLDGFKRSAEYLLGRNLRREEALLPAAIIVQTFKTGKGDKATEEPIYLRKDVVTCRTSESWHKEGRQVKVGQQPLKMVPIRAVTLTRKREIEETERETGEKAMQGMYGKDQTEWIIPAPIKDGVIPKNAYGNMDAFVPQMIPRGAVHIPLRGTVKVCKKLEIDFAEAVTGFEFGNKMAVPVIEGVVVAREHEDRVIDAWEKAEEERKAREAVKQEKLVLGTWRKFLMGLRIMERMRDEYEVNVDGDEREKINPFVNPNRQAKEAPTTFGKRKDDDAPRDHKTTSKNGGPGERTDNKDDVELGGGFLPEGHESSDVEAEQELDDSAGGFLIEADEQTSNGPHPAPKAKIRSLAAIAAELANSEDELSDDTSSDKEGILVPPPTKKTPSKKSTPKVKPTPKTKPKPKVPAKKVVTGRGRPKKQQQQLDDGEDSEELSSISSSEDGLSGCSSNPSTPRTKAVAMSSRPTRASARSAAKAIHSEARSKYFEDE